MATFPDYPTMTKALPPRQLASLPHSGILGWITAGWLWWLRLHLNRDRYRLTLRGRKSRKPRRWGQQSIPLKDARRIGLYVDDKMEGKFRNYNRAWGKHEAQQGHDRAMERIQGRESNLRSELFELHAENKQLIEHRRHDRDQLTAAAVKASTQRLDLKACQARTSNMAGERNRLRLLPNGIRAGLNILTLKLETARPEEVEDHLHNFVATARACMDYGQRNGLDSGELVEGLRASGLKVVDLTGEGGKL